MEPFKTYSVINEDKSRFVKANKVLLPHEKEEILKFLRTNNQADGKLDAKKATTMTYHEYQEFMTKWVSGRKMVLAHKGIKGMKEGADYINVKMKNKEYLAYIPLRYDVAQKFNTSNLGVCQGSWCVGHSSTPGYWNDHIVDDQEVPVYLVSTESKWIVMIQPGNKDFHIWDINNVRPQPHDSIPNFDVHKELMTPGLIKMYDKIRHEHFEGKEHSEIDTEAAERDYDALVSDINRSANDYYNSRENFDNECYQIRQDTMEKVDELRNKQQIISDDLESKLNFAKEQYQKYLLDPNHKIVDQHKQIYIFPKDYKTHIIDDLQSRFDHENEKWTALDDLYNEIDNMSSYEMSDSDVEWTEEPPYEDNIHDHDHHCYILNGRYSDYFDFAEDHFGFSLRHSGERLQGDIDEYIYESAYNYHQHEAESILSEYDLHHPEVANN